MKALGDALQWLLDAIQIWLQCATKPVATLNAVLPEVTDQNYLSSIAAKIWIPPLLISAIISFPVLSLFGIGWNNIGYHLSYWMTVIISLVAAAFITHRVMLGLKLKSEFLQTLVIYTAFMVTYSPLTSLLNIPSTLDLFAAMQNFKQHPIQIDTAISAYIAYVMKLLTPTISSEFILVVSVFVVVIWWGLLALFAESVSQWYGNGRFKCYSAVTVSLGLVYIFMAIVVRPLQMLIFYAFL